MDRPQRALAIRARTSMRGHPTFPQDSRSAARRAARHWHELFASIRTPCVALVAIHVHVGSQITTLEPLRRAAALVARLSDEVKSLGVTLEYLDLGGGLGISYDGREVPSASDYADALVAEVRRTGLPVVVEPGRTIAGPAGVLVARVVDLKPRTAGSDFAVIDAGMTELLRPALYGRSTASSR